MSDIKQSHCDMFDNSANVFRGCSCPCEEYAHVGTCLNADYAGRWKCTMNIPVNQVAQASRLPCYTAGTRRDTSNSRYRKPWLDGLPRIIVVSLLGEAFSPEMSFKQLYNSVIVPIRSPDGRRHCWFWSTKCGQRAYEFWKFVQTIDDWPTNLWIGTGGSWQHTFDERTKWLTLMRGVRKFAVVSPQLESFEAARYLDNDEVHFLVHAGESPTVRQRVRDPRPFDLNWIDEMREQCLLTDTHYQLWGFGSNTVVDDVVVDLGIRRRQDKKRAAWPAAYRTPAYTQIPRAAIWESVREAQRLRPVAAKPLEVQNAVEYIQLHD